ncbi:MAG: kynureninase [Pseudoalteromonas tetraodonis]|jgi:kynureninase
MKPDHSTLFPPAENIYLLSHSIGRMPASTKLALQDNFFSHWESNQTDIWDHWLGSIDKFRSALAQLFNSKESCFCPQSNISSGLGKVVQSLPRRKHKNVILMCEADFPSAGFVLQQAQSNGFELRVLPADADIQNIDTWEQALTADIHTVFITHVQYGTSKRAPVSKICELARAQDVVSIVDVAQSAGVVPIDISKWGCDVVSGSCIKWLCGGPGAGYLWVNEDFVGQLEPADVGWFSHANPFEFDINHFEYAKDSARLWGGTPSVMPYVAAANSIKMIADVGVSVIQQHNQSLIDALSKSVNPDDLISPASGGARGGTLVMNFKDRVNVEQRLNEAGVCYDSRALGLRFSPHIYNSEDEIRVTKQCFES